MLAVGKSNKKEAVSVDMEARMAELGLDKFFPSECWPSSNAVRELATKLKLAKKGRPEHAAVFIFSDLKRYVCAVAFW